MDSQINTMLKPQIYWTYPGRSRVRLPSPSKSDANLIDALLTRKTAREFSGLPIALKQLSNLLYYTWGRVSTCDTPEFGKRLHKTSPSAGARHPVETYAIVNRVSSLRSEYTTTQ